MSCHPRRRGKHNTCEQKKRVSQVLDMGKIRFCRHGAFEHTNILAKRVVKPWTWTNIGPAGMARQSGPRFSAQGPLGPEELSSRVSCVLLITKTSAEMPEDKLHDLALRPTSSMCTFCRSNEISSDAVCAVSKRAPGASLSHTLRGEPPRTTELKQRFPPRPRLQPRTNGMPCRRALSAASCRSRMSKCTLPW